MRKNRENNGCLTTLHRLKLILPQIFKCNLLPHLMYLNKFLTVVSLHIQIALATTQILWTTEVGIAFTRLEEGYENALKDYFKKQVCCHSIG